LKRSAIAAIATNNGIVYSAVGPSVTLMHPAKAVGWMRCHLAIYTHATASQLTSC